MGSPVLSQGHPKGKQHLRKWGRTYPIWGILCRPKQCHPSSGRRYWAPGDGDRSWKHLAYLPNRIFKLYQVCSSPALNQRMTSSQQERPACPVDCGSEPAKIPKAKVLEEPHGTVRSGSHRSVWVWFPQETAWRAASVVWDSTLWVIVWESQPYLCLLHS